jgi:hypothetical protein
MPEVHLKYGGSTATRTMNCGAWAGLSAGMPKQKVGMAASRGTVGHTGFQKMIDSETYEFSEELGMEVVVDGNTVVIDQKLVDKIHNAIEAQEDFFEEHEIETVHTEVMMQSSDVVGGSGDVVGWSKAKNLFVSGDLKTGDGHMVYALDNDQLMFYTWHAVMHFAKDFTFDGNTRIILYIVQPSDRRKEILDTWEVNLGDVMAFGKAFELAVRVSESGLSEPKAGDWCMYCPKAPTCPAKTGLVANSRRMDLDSDDVEVLERGMAMVEEVEQWCRDIRKLAHEELELGGDVAGWKLVNKRAVRAWTNEEEAFTIFKNSRIKIDDYTDRKFKSAPQMEKVCKELGIDWKKYSALVSAVSSGTTMAKSSDPREAAIPLEGLADAVAQLS